MITIEFEDGGQDFLQWDIDEKTGKILDCRPFQASIWMRNKVVNYQNLQPGMNIVITSPYTESGEMVIKYPISNIIKHETEIS